MIGWLLRFGVLALVLVAWNVSKPLAIAMYAGIAAVLAFTLIFYRKR